MTRRNKVLLGLLAFIIAFFGIAAALYLSPPKPDFKSSALFARDAYTKGTKVDVDAHLDRNIVSKGEQVVLQIDVRNNGSETITDFHISASAPGFEWTPKDLDCQLPTTFQADSSATALVPLKALASSGTYNIVLFYSWNKKSRYSSAVSLGPLKMEGLIGQDRWSLFLARGSQLIKDLTLPFVLAGLGAYFQFRQTTRDDAFKLEQKTRDERQAVRQNILPLVMTLAERHYMPIVRSARLLIGDYNGYDTHTKSGSSSERESFDKVFFDVLFLLKRMDYLRREKGQIFFQDSVAEGIASDAWFVLRERLLAVLGDLQVGLALQKIGNDDGFADFAAKRYQYQFGSAHKALADWIKTDPDDFKRYLKLVDLLQAVFRFEANRPFDEHWYNQKRALSFETDLLKNPDFPKAFVTELSRERIEALQKKWPVYLAANQA